MSQLNEELIFHRKCLVQSLAHSKGSIYVRFVFFLSEEITSGCMCTSITQRMRDSKVNSRREKPDNLRVWFLWRRQAWQRKISNQCMEGESSAGAEPGRFRDRS